MDIRRLSFSCSFPYKENNFLDNGCGPGKKSGFSARFLFRIASRSTYGSMQIIIRTYLADSFILTTLTKVKLKVDTEAI